MKSKPVKVWVVWVLHEGRWCPLEGVYYTRSDAVFRIHTYGDTGYRYRITSGTVEPPGEGKGG